MSSLNPGPYEPLNVTLNDQSERQQVDELAGGVFRLCGEVDFQGAGELIAAVEFPIVFTEKPSFVFGGELRENSPVQNGRLPTISGIIKDWRFKTDLSTGRRIYTGASFIIVTTGDRDQLMTFHYQLEAPALNEPTSALLSTAPVLLGATFPPGYPPAPHSPGDGIGIMYIGDADLVALQTMFKIDNQILNPGTDLFFFHDDATFSPPPPWKNTIIYAQSPLSLQGGNHQITVTVRTVDGDEDTRVWIQPFLYPTGGAT